MYLDPLLSILTTLSVVASAICFVVLVVSSKVSRDEAKKLCVKIKEWTK